jgi:hypothetical protein
MRFVVTTLSLLSVLGVALAGCAAGPEAPPVPDAAPTESGSPSQPTPAAPEPDSGATAELDEIPWEILDCRFAYALAAADATAVAALLPAGFTFARDVGPRVLVGFEANSCASGTGLRDPVSPQAYASFWVGVQPPDGLGEAGAAHFVNFDVLVPDQPRRDLLRSWGTPAHDGRVAFTELAEGSLRVEYALDSVGSFSISAAGAGSGPGMAGTFDQWTPGPSGLTYWRTDFAATALFQGPGLLEVDAASPYAGWFEAPTIPAVVTFGDWSYTSGAIRHPGR